MNLQTKLFYIIVDTLEFKDLSQITNFDREFEKLKQNKQIYA